MSKLSQIFSLFDAKTILLPDGTAIGSRGLSKLPDSLSTAQLPTRLLLPFGSQAGRNRMEIPPQEYGHMKWRITDLMLWRPVAQGIGVRSVALPVVQYEASYCTALLALNATLDDNLLIQACDISPGIYEYPLGGGVWYFGVECVTTVQELLL